MEEIKLLLGLLLLGLRVVNFDINKFLLRLLLLDILDIFERLILLDLLNLFLTLLDWFLQFLGLLERLAVFEVRMFQYLRNVRPVFCVHP